MLHSGNQVDANEALYSLRSHCCDHALIVVDGVQRRDGRIVPAMVQDEFATAPTVAIRVMAAMTAWVEIVRMVFVGSLRFAALA